MDLPAPVSPDSTLKPAPNSTAASARTARLRTWSSRSTSERSQRRRWSIHGKTIPRNGGSLSDPGTAGVPPATNSQEQPPRRHPDDHPQPRREVARLRQAGGEESEVVLEEGLPIGAAWGGLHPQRSLPLRQDAVAQDEIGEERPAHREKIGGDQPAGKPADHPRR